MERDKERRREEARRIEMQACLDKIARLPKTVVVNGVELEISYDYYGDYPRTDITLEQLSNLDNDQHVELEDGTKVELRCCGYHFNQVRELKNKLAARSSKHVLEIVKSTLPKTSAIKRGDIPELIQYLGKQHAPCAGNFFNYAFVHLEVADGQVKLAVSLDEKKANDSTVDSLRWLVQREIRENFGDKKFQMKVNGKWVWTKIGQRAKADFDAFVNDAMKELTPETYTDVMEYVREAFLECTKDLPIAS